MEQPRYMNSKSKTLRNINYDFGKNGNSATCMLKNGLSWNFTFTMAQYQILINFGLGTLQMMDRKGFKRLQIHFFFYCNFRNVGKGRSLLTQVFT